MLVPRFIKAGVFKSRSAAFVRDPQFLGRAPVRGLAVRKGLSLSGGFGPLAIPVAALPGSPMEAAPPLEFAPASSGGGTQVFGEPLASRTWSRTAPAIQVGCWEGRWPGPARVPGRAGGPGLGVCSRTPYAMSRGYEAPAGSGPGALSTDFKFPLLGMWSHGTAVPALSRV